MQQRGIMRPGCFRRGLRVSAVAQPPKPVAAKAKAGKKSDAAKPAASDSATSPSAYLAGSFTSGRISMDKEDKYEDILEVGSLRKSLTPRDSPFVVDNNSGGGFGES
eukprot:gene31073-6200_t